MLDSHCRHIGGMASPDDRRTDVPAALRVVEQAVGPTSCASAPYGPGSALRFAVRWRSQSPDETIMAAVLLTELDGLYDSLRAAGYNPGTKVPEAKGPGSAVHWTMTSSAGLRRLAGTGGP